MDTEQAGTIHVDLVYAGRRALHCASLRLHKGATIADAIKHSGVLERYPEIDLGKNKVGIFSRLQRLDTVLHDHDRVEIYRPLLCDPKTSRRRRAARKQSAKRQ